MSASWPPRTLTRPITVALVDDYDVVVMGVANILDQYRDRVVVAEIDTNRPVSDAVDIVLYDSFAQPESDHDEIGVLVGNPNARRVVVFTWNFHPTSSPAPGGRACSGYLSKALPARDLVAALEASTPARSWSAIRRPRPPGNGLDWPGRGEGLTDRESEILALITQGLSNADVARAHLPQPEHGQVLHPLDLPQDRRREPDPGGAVGGRQRLRPRPPPDRPLARRPLTPPTTLSPRSSRARDSRRVTTSPTRMRWCWTEVGYWPERCWRTTGISPRRWPSPTR